MQNKFIIHTICIPLLLCSSLAFANKFEALGTSGPLLELDLALEGTTTFVDCLTFETQMVLNETTSRSEWTSARDSYDKCVSKGIEIADKRYSAATAHLKNSKKSSSLDALTASYLEWQKQVSLKVPPRNETPMDKRMRELEYRKAASSYRAHAKIYYDKLRLEK